MTCIATVKPSALATHARVVLSLATNDWRRLPLRHAATAWELERAGLVETETRWVWSTRDSGAGKHVVFWRLHA